MSGPFSVLQRIGCEWAIRSFGMEHVANPPVRALRIVEEAIEAAQAFDVPLEQVLKCAEVVYSRPKGDPVQELGGVLLTAAILCEAIGAEAELVLERELRRVLAKSPEEFAARNEEKLKVGLTGLQQLVQDNG